MRLVAVGDEVLLSEGETVGAFAPTFGVLAEDIDFDVEGVSGRQGSEVGCGVRVRNDGNLDLVVVDGGDGQGDAFDGDRAFFDDVAHERVGDGEAKAVVGGVAVEGDGIECDEGRGGVDVTLDDVSAERRAGGGGELEIDDGVGPEARERGACDGLCGEIGGEARRKGVGFYVERGEADSADGDRVTRIEAADERGRCGDGDAGDAGVWGDVKNGSRGFDQAGEHGYRVQEWPFQCELELFFRG